MPQMGVDKNRLLKKRLASNMGREFAAIVTDFEETIRKMGSIP